MQTQNAIVAFLLANTKNRIVFVPCAGDEEVSMILRRIPAIAPGDPERLPLGVAPGDEPDETIFALNKLFGYHGIDVSGPQPIYCCSHPLTLLRLAQAFASLIKEELPKAAPKVAPPAFKPHQPAFMQGKQVLCLRIQGGEVVTEIHDIPPGLPEDGDDLDPEVLGDRFASDSHPRHTPSP